MVQASNNHTQATKAGKLGNCSQPDYVEIFLSQKTNKQKTDDISARALEQERVNKTWDLDTYITDINFIV